jgi:tripartite-type tricarboxylate transporter receptor subunit TctC
MNRLSSNAVPGRSCTALRRPCAPPAPVTTVFGSARGAISIAASSIVLLSAVVGTASAQPVPYPSKPIRFIIDFPAGGVSDILSRLVGERMADSLGRPLVFDNRPGASGLIAYDLGAKAPADGYTVLFASTPFAFHLNLRAKMPFDTEKDFAPVALFAQFPNVLLVSTKSPITTVKEFLEAARGKAGGFNYGSLGIGSPQHLAMELFRTQNRFSATHVPYPGSPQALTALIGGQTDVMFGNVPGALAQIKGGKVRGLAMASATRSSALPDIPTFREQGIAFEAVGFGGIVVPSGTPRAVITRLNADAVKALQNPDTAERIRNVGGEPLPGTPEDFRKFLQSEIKRWAPVIKESGAKSEVD